MATTKKQRTTMNIIMVALAVVVVAAGAFFVMSVRGGQSQDSPFTVSEKIGYANIERAGLSYVLDKGTALQDGDVIETLNGSELGVEADKSGTVILADASKMSVHLDKTDNALTLENGSSFVDVNGENLNLQSLGLSWTSQDAICVLSARTGSTTVQVLAGEVACSDGASVKAGQSYSVTADKSSSSNASKVTTLSIESLDAFALDHALATINSGRTLCFTEKQITDVQESRAAEREQMEKDASAASKSSSSAASSDDSTLEANDELQTEEAAPEEGSSDTETYYAADETQATEYESQNDTPEEAETTYTEDSGMESEVQESANDVYTCTIQIRCDTILDNMDKLAEGKSKYVPRNGVLLASSTVNFTEGETAFDVLKAVCDQAGISLEYSYAPVYGSYYVEGIGNLYEFDCGDESGWMYKVNGWFPNYGCSEYTLSDGDAISFCYTCKGLGDDVGA